MKTKICIFICLVYYFCSIHIYSQTCITISFYQPGCETSIGGGKGVTFTTYTPNYETFTLTTSLTGQIYHCFNYPSQTYFMTFDDIDCHTPCSDYFVPNNIGSFKIPYTCFPYCNCSDDKPKINEETLNVIPSKFNLYQNYPNPFNPTTEIKFDIAKEGFLNIRIYDMDGKEITTLISENYSPGTYSVNFDASDLPSGIYLYTIVTNNYIESKKMVLIK